MNSIAMKLPWMFSRKRILRLRPPEMHLRRRGLHLLIWGDIPFWTVVDDDLHGFLRRLDGAASLDDVINSRTEWSASRREILRSVRELETHGAVVDSASAPSVPSAQESALPPIENVAINLTNRCNLRCRFCYNLDRPCGSAQEELTTQEILGLLDRVKPRLSKRATITVLGGEPLLAVDRLLSVADWARNARVQRLVSTNGTLVTDDFVRGARRTGLDVQVSLDGHTAALHESVRGAGSFEKAAAGVRALVGGGVHTVISMVCHEKNVAHLEQFFDLARSLGAHEARFIPLKLLGGAREGAFRPAPTAQIVREAVALFQRRPEFIPMAGRDAFNILAGTCGQSVRRASCGTGGQTFLLDSDGSIFPCLNNCQPQQRAGNIREAGFDFERFWKTSAALESHRRAAEVCRIEGCRDCALRQWCLAGCRGEACATTGRLDAPPPNCADLKEALLEIMWTIAEKPAIIRGGARNC